MVPRFTACHRSQVSPRQTCNRSKLHKHRSSQSPDLLLVRGLSEAHRAAQAPVEASIGPAAATAALVRALRAPTGSSPAGSSPCWSAGMPLARRSKSPRPVEPSPSSLSWAPGSRCPCASAKCCTAFELSFSRATRSSNEPSEYEAIYVCQAADYKNIFASSRRGHTAGACSRRPQRRVPQATRCQPCAAAALHRQNLVLKAFILQRRHGK